MNKTELFRHYRWLWFALPIPQVVAMYVVVTTIERNWLRVPTGVGPLVDIAASFAPLGSIVVTAACSGVIASLSCEDAQLRGVLRVIVVILVGVMLTVAQLLAAGMLCSYVAALLSKL